MPSDLIEDKINIEDQPEVKEEEVEVIISKNNIHITRDEERKLIERYKINNDISALETLLEVHYPYVQHQVAKAYKKFSKVIEYEDLVQQARIGMIKAAQQFDLNKVVTDEKSQYFGQPLRFLTYAHKWMIAQMQDAWHHGHAVHIPAHTLRAIQFKKTGDKEVIFSEKTKMRIRIAKKAMKAQSLDALMDDFKNKENRSSNAYEIERNQNGVKMIDPTFEEGISEMFSPGVAKAIDKLSEIEWMIFKLKLGIENGTKLPTEEISKALALDISEVDRLFKKAKRILSKNIKSKCNYCDTANPTKDHVCE